MKKFLTKNYKSIISALILVCVLALPLVVGAQTSGDLKTKINTNMEATQLQGSLGGSGQDNLPKLIGNIITAALALLGVVFVALTIYAGFKWMTAQGDSAKVDKAKAMLVQSTIGLAIMLVSYGIASFVINTILNSTNG